jgi:plasmid stabilization system protein ParE
MMYSPKAQMAIERFAECEGTSEYDIEKIRHHIAAIADAKRCTNATVQLTDVLMSMRKLGYESESLQVFRAVRG